MAKNNGSYQRNSFAGIPRIVMDHPDYIGLSFSAKAALQELARQYRGQNNGDLTLAWSVLKPRGFGSKGTVTKLTEELLAANLIVRTRVGVFRNPGAKCALYALSWIPINECPGKQLEVGPTTTPPRQFSIENNKTPGPQNEPGSVHKLGRDRPRDSRGRYSSS